MPSAASDQTDPTDPSDPDPATVVAQATSGRPVNQWVYDRAQETEEQRLFARELA